MNNYDDDFEDYELDDKKNLIEFEEDPIIKNKDK